MKYTRKDKLEGKCSHREYYAQFVDDNVKRTVIKNIGFDRLVRSKDNHLNDIPLTEWDMTPLPHRAVKGLKKAGDNFSMAGKVCILKEAAKQLQKGLSVVE